MPIYQVHHVCPLTDEQQDQLAEAITVCHTEILNAPRLFVNVFFVDAAKQNRYVAGKRVSHITWPSHTPPNNFLKPKLTTHQRKTNLIMAETRHSPSRTQEMYQAVIKILTESWSAIVGKTGDKELRGLFFSGGLVAAAEVGFPLAQAGHDDEWVREHYAEFEKLAESGDEDFITLVEELKTREYFKRVLGGKQ